MIWVVENNNSHCSFCFWCIGQRVVGLTDDGDWDYNMIITYYDPHVYVYIYIYIDISYIYIIIYVYIFTAHILHPK